MTAFIDIAAWGVGVREAYLKVLTGRGSVWTHRSIPERHFRFPGVVLLLRYGLFSNVFVLGAGANSNCAYNMLLGGSEICLKHVLLAISN